MNVHADHSPWALGVLRESLEGSGLGSDQLAAATADRRIPDDPEKLRYIQQLIRFILDGRAILTLYNPVLIAILALVTLIHVCQRVKEISARKTIEGDGSTGIDNDATGLKDSNNGGESSSSSTLNMPDLLQTSSKPDESDLERQPLLGRPAQEPSRQRSQSNWFNALRAWLVYQPSPLPLVQRTLPSNATTLSVLTYISLNVFFHLYRLPFEWRYFFAFADRAGMVFVANLPLLYLLAAKNQPLKLLTGRSYEALNIYHRRVGEFMCFEAFLHFAGMLIWRLSISPDWLKQGDFWHFITHPLVLLGIGAFVSYELLYFTSLGSFRERWYELFLASHVFLQIAALVFLWLHFPTARPYVWISLAIFVVDRLIWRISLKSTTLAAELTILEDGQTVLLSSDWDIPRPGGLLRRLLRRSIIHGWQPADHVFVSIPILGKTHALQAHPFTIASAAPEPPSSQTPTHAWLSLLIRVHSGFTSALLQHARVNSRAQIRLDGPYGSHDPLNMLRASPTDVLVAGGSGIAVVFPLAWALAQVHRGRRRRVHLYWVVRSRRQISWVPEERLDELRRAGVEITIPLPTLGAGRPDIPAYVADVVGGAEGEVGIVVSGPDGLNREVRNACAAEVKAGAKINLRVEKFGW
ncbi:hypothetical protein F5Y15DRAFT_411025 [Xylariaceae sp. FL0016]|nr:hypothetical protein F5Y15DRAFT_411025 [Xylariaceae sp. FL0016]